jgi:poly-gamma-glutamate synthase PgsB/CapB
MIVALGLIAFVFAYWSFEAVRIRRARRALPIRIHVNGSRGKSSVTRLIAAGLRESGLRTVAKATGSRARLILPDGREEPVVRLGTPNIGEQVRILDRARREGATAMVMECMAVRPDLQRVTEDSIMHATIGVITNARADHLDVMGPTVADVAKALAATVPRRGHLVVGRTHSLDILAAAARRRGSTLIVAEADAIAAGALAGFGYVEHEENVATALAVTRLLGIADDVAIRGMHRVVPDPGACTRRDFAHRGRPIQFVNIFAANDLESTVAVWERVGLATPGLPTFALMNLRGDRLKRSLEFAAAVEKDLQADYYIVAGDYTDRVRRRFAEAVPADRLLLAGRIPPVEIFDLVIARAEHGARVGGVGNIGGLGHDILAFVAAAAHRGWGAPDAAPGGGV